MGGYKSLKRVLGETHLGRKLRWLFGVSLFALIFIAFFAVDRIGEDLVMKNIYRNGREWVRYHQYDKHWAFWDTDPKHKEFRSAFSQKLLPAKFEAISVAENRQVVDSLPADVNQGQIRILVPDSARNEPPQPDQAEVGPEQQLIAQLKRDFERALADAPKPLPAGASAEDVREQQYRFQEHLDRVYATRVDTAADKYYYYQPVYWDTTVCSFCHEGRYGIKSTNAALALSDVETDHNSQLPFVVTRVDLPYAKTRSAVHQIRAVLSTVGILTVFLAMISLWMVVRYVVLKPLAHLREVSDSVTRGQLDQRAEINTNDEFQELAASFNKMLRHLIEAQGQLQTANAELDGKVDQLAQLNMQLHELNRLKGEFLATMSHELRTPLNSIIGFSEVLGGIDSLDDKQKRYVHNIQKSGQSLLEMINDILDLSKLEAGKMDVRPSEFRIDHIIETQCDLVRALTEDKNIDLATDIEPELPVLFQDQTKVQQIITNLLSNAIKFTPEGGRITVGAKGDPRGFVEIFVADTGVGIAESDREIIFEKFRQGTSVMGRDTLTREYSGTGLGLSIVKELCKLLGGEVQVESELGRGSTFRVLIPWMRVETAPHASKLAAKLDDLTRPRRVDVDPGVSADTVLN